MPVGRRHSLAAAVIGHSCVLEPGMEGLQAPCGHVSQGETEGLVVAGCRPHFQQGPFKASGLVLQGLFHGAEGRRN